MNPSVTQTLHPVQSVAAHHTLWKTLMTAAVRVGTIAT